MKQPKEKISGFKNVVKCVKFFTKYVFEEKPIFYMYYVGLIIISAIGPFFNIIGTKYLIDELAYSHQRDINKIIFWVAFIGIGNFLYNVIRKFTSEKCYQHYDQFDFKMENNLSMHAIRMKFAETENPKTLDVIKNAERGLEETSCIRGILEKFSIIISNILVVFGVATLAFSCSALLVVPVIVGFVVSTIFNRRMNNVRSKYFNEISDAERVNDYFSKDVRNSKYAKDIRIYNIKDMLIKKNTSTGYDLAGKIRKRNQGMWANQRIGISVNDLCIASLYAILGVKALVRQITIGEFSSLLQATTQFTMAIEAIVWNYIDLDYTANILRYYIDFVQYVEDIEQKEVENAIDIPEEANHNITIEFKNVSFKYPNTELFVLKNVNTVIKSGEHLSIVGENGAGKTTFIKLLCRMYDVTEGEILVNGININKFSFREYRRLLSVVFQDYKLLAFSIRENIILDNKNVPDEKIMELCKIGGIDEWIKSTEKGLDTILYKMFDETGIEPSGGQAQKIAITRALYKNAPVVILDEPTASLDPISEYEIYKNFDKLVGGKTAVYISHRLSSCRFCDRIIVFNNGTIIEDGSHDELYNLESGFYSKMYRTQAKHYN